MASKSDAGPIDAVYICSQAHRASAASVRRLVISSMAAGAWRGGLGAVVHFQGDDPTPTRGASSGFYGQGGQGHRPGRGCSVACPAPPTALDAGSIVHWRMRTHYPPAEW